MAGVWFCSDKRHKQQLEEAEARCAAAVAECNRLRNENEQLRKMARHPVMMLGGDEGGGEVTYKMSDGGW